MVNRVWDHMVRTAPIARELAPRFGVAPDQAFLIALLHDVGKLAIFDRVSALRVERRGGGRFAPGFLSRLLRETHPPLGGAIALSWRLGSPAARAIADHHRIGVDDSTDRMSEVVCLAERVDLAVSCRRPIDAVAFWDEARLSGSPGDLEEILEIARQVTAGPSEAGGGSERRAA
jgi:HD-like signal output (HDOD) protein